MVFNHRNHGDPIQSGCAKALFSLVFTSITVFSAMAADTLVTADGSSVEGTFDGFKTEKIHFKTADGEKLKKAAKEVVSLQVDPQARVTLKPKGKKAIKEIKIEGFEKGNFKFSNGTSMPASQVSLIEVELDIARESILAAAKTTTKAETGEGGEALDLESLVEKDVVTILHIHVDKASSAERVIMYANGLANESNGKIVLKKADIGSWNSATAKKYGITVAPQFWVYNRSGELVKKVTDYRSPEELEKVVKQAKK